MISTLKNLITLAEKGEFALRIPLNDFIDQMKRLEQELEHKVLKTRSENNISLTDFAKNFIPYAKKCLRILEDGIYSSSDENNYEMDQHLTIGIARDSMTTWAINCIKNFNKMHPGLRLSVIADDNVTPRMINNSTIIFWCVEGDLPGFNKIWYIEYKYGLYASESYLQKYGEPALSTMKNHKVIAYSGKDNNASLSNWHLTGEYNLPPLKPSIFSQSRDLIVKMASEGLGIGAICERQDVYYGYPLLRRVLKFVDGPVLRSYFMIRNGINEQVHCNVALFDQLFKLYFKSQNIEICYCK
ncbi:MAG: LysR family transcriptional regulator [Holosporales bacterium]|jgi:DNA-binding transcriptional LysR family regulator|nr:LysR family transcriptional regulator [Holosporales bacterium]